MKALSKKFLQTYLTTEQAEYFISTCHRAGSNEEKEWYYETLSWKLDNNMQKIPHTLKDYTDGNTYPQDAITEHYKVISELLRKPY